jgi:hypothetical protein
MLPEVKMSTRAWVAYFVVASGTVGVAQVAPSARPPRSAEIQPRMSILCGMRVFHAAPNIDRKIAKPTPSGAFTLRTVRPPVCRDAFPAPLAELKQRLPEIFGPKR